MTPPRQPSPKVLRAGSASTPALVTGAAPTTIADRQGAARAENALVRVGAALEAFGGRRTQRTDVALTMVAIVALGAALMLYRLGAAEVCSSNEAVEALAVQQMVEHGELLAPVTNGRDAMYKPPLFHWTAAALAYAFGMRDVTELTVRLPSVLYAVAGVAVTMAFVLRWLGLSAAVLCGLVLLASYQYVDQARFGRVDMTLAFCEALALFSFLWWLNARDEEVARAARAGASTHESRVAHFVLAIALGLGVLAKGPVGMALPLVGIAVYLVGERRWRDLRRLCAPGPALVLLVVSSSWYAACLWRRRIAVLDRQLGDENLARLIGGLGTMPPWYYLKPLLLASVPFSLLAPIAVARALRSPDQSGERIATLRSALDRTAPRFLAVFWVAAVVVFSIAAYKRRAYLLPLTIPGTVLLVWWLASLRDSHRRRRSQGALVVAAAAAITFNLLYLPHARIAACRGGSYRAAADAIGAVVPRGEALYAYGLGPEPDPALLFYLARTVPPLAGPLGAAPPGYVLMPQETALNDRDVATFRSVLAVTAGRRRLILCERRARRRSAAGAAVGSSAANRRAGHS